MADWTQNTGESAPYLFDFSTACLDSLGATVRALVSSVVTTSPDLTAGTKTDDLTNAVVQQFASSTVAGTYIMRCRATFDDGAILDASTTIQVTEPTV